MKEISDYAVRRIMTRLVLTGKIKEADIEAALSAERSNLAEQLELLGGVERGRTAVRAELQSQRAGLAAADDSKAKKATRPRAEMSPEQLASRQLQGRYLALVRKFSPKERTVYGELAKKRGRDKAVAAMEAKLKQGARLTRTRTPIKPNKAAATAKSKKKAGISKKAAAVATPATSTKAAKPRPKKVRKLHDFTASAAASTTTEAAVGDKGADE